MSRFSAIAVGFLFCVPLALATVRAAEPAYALTLGKETLRLTVETTDVPEGGKAFRLRTAPVADTKLLISEDIRVAVDPMGKVTVCRSDVHLPVLAAFVLEAEQQASGWTVRAPEQSGVTGLGAPVLTTADLLGFVGKRYDFARGGPQPFALMIGLGGAPADLLTMTLTSAGKEKLKLADGDVTARKLTFSAQATGQPNPNGRGTLWIGPNGEVLKADIPAMGPVIAAKGMARTDGDSLTTEFEQPKGLMLRTTRTASGHEAKFTFGEALELSKSVVDTHFRPTHVESALTGRLFTADLTTTQMRWHLAAGDPQTVAVPSGSLWFFPYYVVTDLWETREPFMSQAVGDKQMVSYLPLELGAQQASNLTVERLADTRLSLADGSKMTLHHWRLTNPVTAYDLWTDGRRLVKLDSPGGEFNLVRDGWQTVSASLKAPPVPKTPAAP